MYGALREDLTGRLAETRAAGTYKTELVMTTPQGAMREIYNGQRMYIKFPPAMRKGILARKPWTSVDITGNLERAAGMVALEGGTR